MLPCHNAGTGGAVPPVNPKVHTMPKQTTTPKAATKAAATKAATKAPSSPTKAPQAASPVPTLAAPVVPSMAPAKPAKAKAVSVEDIPADWRKAHHKRRMAWAKVIAGAEVTTSTEANRVIAQHLGEPEVLPEAAAEAIQVEA